MLPEAPIHFNFDLLSEIKTFLLSRNEEHKELSGDAWLVDLWFLTDLTAKLNALNVLQGKDRNLPHVISAVNAFQAKLSVWSTHLKNVRLTHFLNKEKMSQAIEVNDVHPEQYCAQMDKASTEFIQRFL